MDRYWEQYSRSEIDAMHGCDSDDFDDEDKDYDTEVIDDEDYNGELSLDSLGMSIRDFM